MLDLSRLMKESYPSVISALETDSETLMPFTFTISLFEYLNINSGFIFRVRSKWGFNISNQIERIHVGNTLWK